MASSTKMTAALVPKELASTKVIAVYGGIAAVTLILPVIHCLRHDYKAYLALGPGGTPSTFAGYLRVKVLGVFALHNPYVPPPVPHYLKDQPGYLKELQGRQGPRPKTRGIAPHRQVTQKASKEVFDMLADAINFMGMTNDKLILGTSCFEKHGTGLFSTSPARRTCKGEICHAHPSDGSLHMTLHPADAKVVLEAGLGERHPIARGGWFERFVPGGFLMIYAPRTEVELQTVLEIVKAAAWWVSGGDGIKDKFGEWKDSGYVTDVTDDEE